MTFGFDFDQLEEEDGIDEEHPPEEAEWAAELQKTERSLLDEVRRGASGRARGLCLHCHGCRGWAPSSSSTAAPRTLRPRGGGEAELAGWPETPSQGDHPPLEARGTCLPSLCGAMPSFDGRRFTWPKKPDAHGRSDFGNWGEGWPCARCGCAEREHEDVQAKFGRFLAEHDSIPLEALHWSHLELALWADTEGMFRPGSKRIYCADETKPGVLVSVICPTTGSRSCFHPFLWHCFEKQEHAPRELVVIDTNEEEPSAFLEEKARSDSRLLYKHFRVPEKKWCIGLKRNLACYYASGEVIAHFDDDDMYAPVYLSVMLKCLRDPKEAFVIRSINSWNSGGSPHEVNEMLHALNCEDAEHGARVKQMSDQANFWIITVLGGSWGAACAKLCSWFNFSLKERAWGHCDATDSEVPFTKDSRQEIYGWGFSLVYLRLAWQVSPFLHIDLGEDLDFVYSFRELGLPLVLLPDRKGICAHTQHLENVSGLCMRGGSRGVTPSALLYSPLASVLSWYDIAAQGFCKYQQNLKEGTLDKAISPGLLLAAQSKPAVKPVVEAAKPEKWLPGMKWTKEAVVLFQQELLEELIAEPFQKQLHDKWREFSGDPRKQEVHRRNICLEVQAPILELYGFEGSAKGLFQSAMDCRLPDEKIGMYEALLVWLTHPGHKAWQILWPFLPVLREDRSWGTLRASVIKAHELIDALDGQDQQPKEER